jgi:hypothetical protein
VQREAYYGGTFVGNHVNKCLKVVINAHNELVLYPQPENITTLCQSVVVTAEEECPTLVNSAKTICEQFSTTLSLFSHCHRLYSSKFLSADEICSLG